MLILDKDDPTKTAVTIRDGRPAKIYAVYAEGEALYQIHGAILDDSKRWQLASWRIDGDCYVLGTKDEVNDQDLINAPPPAHAVVVNIYKKYVRMSPSVDAANAAACPNRICSRWLIVQPGEFATEANKPKLEDL
jgi:hypothetical protein